MAEDQHVPSPSECQKEAHLGRFFLDEENQILYECSFDPRRGVFTWAIVPPVDSDEKQ